MEDADVLGQVIAGSTEKNPSLDFSRVTPSQFGISTESFIPSSRNKDKSRLSQLKARRRSTIGVRGSPETNSLIRYMAQQKCRTPPSLPPSPFIAHGFSTLRQKMAIFQSLLDIDEVPKAAELLPGVERKEVSDDSSAVTAKENMDPQGCLISATPPSYKKPRMECVQVSPYFLVLSSPPAPCSPLQHPGPPPDAVVLDRPELEYAICESPLSCHAADPGGSDLELLPPAEAQQAHSTGHTRPDSNGLHLPDEPGAPRSVSLMFLSPPAEHSTCEVTSAADGPLSTKKRVRFGAPLTPEIFDMTLPPSTPLQKGGTPARLIASAGPQFCSLLKKTPHRSPQHFPQPDFGSPSETRGAPAEMRFDQTEHNREDDECPQVSLLDVIEDSQCTLSTSGVAPAPIASCQPQSGMIPPVRQDSFAGTHPESEHPSDTEKPPIDTAPACSRGRKRKQILATRKRASRTAAVCASQKIKGSSRKKHWGSKEVDRSLYGKRDYASKNPTLSPISEAVLSASSSPALQPDHSREQPSGELERPALEVPNAAPSPKGSDLTASVIAAAAMWRMRFCPRLEGPTKDHSDDMAGDTLGEEVPSAGLDQQSGRGGRRSPGVGCMVDTEMEPADGTNRASSSYPTHSSGLGDPPLEESTQVNSDPHKEGGDADWHMLQECSEPGTNSGTAAPPQLGGSLSEIGMNQMIKRSRKGQGGNSRRSCQVQDSQVHIPAEEQTPAQQVPDPSLSGVREEARWEGRAMMGVPSTDSSEVNQDAVRTDQGLPWQLPDFSIDDVLQHPSRGRRSVRRSLRNQANTDPSEGGLAWVLQTSPDLSVNRSLRRGSKRWTRPTLPEEAGL